MSNTELDLEPDRLALEQLVVENRELERLEALIARFNLFEALGVVRQELRHSDFLAFLLDPRQSHGLGDLVLRRFLQRAIRASRKSDLPVSLIDLDVWDLHDAVVLREWRSIDLLVRDEPHRLLVVIENKVDSGEHSAQLGRYWEVASREFPGWKVVGLFLTPEVTPPSDERYIAVGYELLAELARELVDSRGEALATDVRLTLAHYSEMLRRHIVSDSDIAELCRQIYQRHQRALDLILEHRPDYQAAIRDTLLELIKQTEGLIIDRAGKRIIDFLPAAWDSPEIRQGTDWTSSRRMLMFELYNEPQRLRVQLWIGPGPSEVRERLFARALQPPFKPSSKKPYAKWNSIWSRDFLPASAYEGATPGELVAKVQEQWQKFAAHDLPSLATQMQQEINLIRGFPKAGLLPLGSVPAPDDA